MKLTENQENKLITCLRMVRKQNYFQFNNKISSPAINIHTSVNMAFTADKLNTAKSYVDITDC